MYLFSSDPALLIPPGRFLHGHQPFGCFHLVPGRRGVLLWAENAFTTCTSTHNSVRIEIRRPEIDHHAASSFEWNQTRGRVHFNRNWSSAFNVRFSRNLPLIVASHAKLAALALKSPISLQSLDAGSRVSLDLAADGTRQLRHAGKPMNPNKPHPLSYGETVAHVRAAVIASVKRNASDGAAMLLSGGVDSTILAAVAAHLGFRLQTFTFALLHPPRTEQGLSSDRVCAEDAASRYGHAHQTILLDIDSLKRNIPAAIYLAETTRGTIVDELTAHIEMARVFKAQDIRRVLTGEGADDLFGAFPFALRYYQGRQLRAFLQRELVRGLPDELAILQNIYSPWDVSLVHPYWTEQLRFLGYSLPLRYRVDRARLMKRVLRDAFSDLLPVHLLTRGKGVPRDCTQIRDVLGQTFGSSPNRYRPILRKMMERRSHWPDELRRTLLNN